MTTTVSNRGATFTEHGAGKTGQTTPVFMFHWSAITLVPRTAGAPPTELAETVMTVCTRAIYGSGVAVRDVWSLRRHWGEYRRAWIGPHGIILAANSHSLTTDGKQHLHLRMEGHAHEQMTVGTFRGIVGQLNNVFELRCTRLDFCFLPCPFTVEQVKRACRRGNLKTWSKSRTGGHRYKIVRSEGDEPGETVYIGSTRSLRFSRVYDRSGPTKIELVSKGNKARRAFEHLLLGALADDAIPDDAKGILLSYVNFIRRHDDRCVTRCRRLRWWQRFIGSAVAVPLVIRRKATSEAAARRHIDRNAAMLETVLRLQHDPDAFLRQLRERGSHAMTAKHRRIIAESVNANERECHA